MKKRIRETRVEKPEEEQFYEAMPVAERPVYRQPLLVREDDSPMLSTWAVVGLILLGLILLLWVMGRGINLSSGTNTTPVAPTTQSSGSTAR